MKNVEHGIYVACFDNLGYLTDGRDCMIECLCGFGARGRSWETAGCLFDIHLKEASVNNTQKESLCDLDGI